MKMNVKYLVPMLLVLLLGATPFVFASASADAGAVETVAAEHVVADTAATDAGHAAVVEEGSATEAAAAHGGEAVHVRNSLSKEKLMDLFWRVINFAALMIILVKYCAKPIGNALSGRQAKVISEIEDLEVRRAKAESEYREFEAKLATVEKDIDTIVDKAVAQAKIEQAKIIEKAEQAAKDIQRSANQAIQNEIIVARRTLKNDVADQATIMAEELIVKNLTAADQVKIVEDYLVKVGAVQ